MAAPSRAGGAGAVLQAEAEAEAGRGGAEPAVLLRKGPWMPEEDEILVDYVNQYGPRDWSSIRSKGLLPRTGKSCRLRWVNKLKPDLKSGCKFSPEEEKLVVEMQAKLGNKWAKIASYLPGRTDNDVKNFWSTRQKRLLRALQRPKATADHSATCNGATTYAGSYAMDHNNIDHLGSDAHCFNDFAFQVHSSPTRGYNSFNSNNVNGVDDISNSQDQLFIRGQPVSDLRRLRHPGGGYNIINNNKSSAQSNIMLSCPEYHQARHRHHHHNDLFMVKLNDLVPNEAVQGAAFMDTSASSPFAQHDNFSSASSPIGHSDIGAANNNNSTIGSTMSSSKCAATAAAAAMVSKSLRSVKNRRPRYTRPRIENISMGVLETGNSMVDQKGSVDHLQLLKLNGDSSGASCSPMLAEAEADHQLMFRHDLYGGEPPTEASGLISDYLSDFLMLHYNDSSCCSTIPTTASTNSSSGSGRPDSPLVLAPPLTAARSEEEEEEQQQQLQLLGCGLSQWDKLPLLASYVTTALGGQLCESRPHNFISDHATHLLQNMNMSIKEEVMDSSSSSSTAAAAAAATPLLASNSCTPDSVLVTFPNDVFDSLEPLSPSSSEWWQR